MRQVGRRGLVQIGLVELAEFLTPSRPRQRITSSSSSSSMRRTPSSPLAASAQQAADADEIGAHRDRLDDVAASAEAAVDHDFRAAGDLR